MAQGMGAGFFRLKCVFLFSAGLPGEVLRQPKQCRSKHLLIVSEDRGVTSAQIRGEGVVQAKMCIFIPCRAHWGRFAPSKRVEQQVPSYMSKNRGVTLTPVRGGGLCSQKCVFLFSAGLRGNVPRQPKQCRSKHDLNVSDDRGVTLAQVREDGV